MTDDDRPQDTRVWSPQSEDHEAVESWRCTEALEAIRFALESGPVAVPAIEEALDLIERYMAEFSPASTGERNR
jgi:hypothetical protein